MSLAMSAEPSPLTGAQPRAARLVADGVFLPVGTREEAGEAASRRAALRAVVPGTSREARSVSKQLRASDRRDLRDHAGEIHVALPVEVRRVRDLVRGARV